MLDGGAGLTVDGSLLADLVVQGLANTEAVDVGQVVALPLAEPLTTPPTRPASAAVTRSAML